MFKIRFSRLQSAWLRRSGLVALLASVLAWALAHPGIAYAHAYLVKSTPAAGSALASSPAEIDLYFSESPSLDFSAIQLYNRARAEQPVRALGHVGSDENSLQVSIEQTLPAGIYTVVWRVVSASDGHLTAGSFAFRVDAAPGSTGTPAPGESITPNQDEGSAAQVSTPDENADPLRWTVRALILAFSAMLLGGCLFTLLISEPLLAEGREQRPGKALWPMVGIRFARMGAWLSGMLFLILVVDLVAEVSTITGTGYLQALSGGNQAIILLTSTSYGFAWILKAASAVVLNIFMLVTFLRMVRNRPGLWEFSIAAGSLLLLGLSLGGHAAATRSGLLLGLSLPVVSDWLHQVVTAAWIGGLSYMAFILFPAFGVANMTQDERRAFLARGIPRFSQLAVISVVVLVVTGTYNLAVHSTDIGAILGTEYGQVLLIKHVILLALIAFGAVNLLRITPLLRARRATEASPAKRGAVMQLRSNVRVEAVLAAAALACAGGLTLLPPPSQAASDFAQAASEQSLTSQSTPAQLAFPPTPLPTPGPVTVQSTVAGYLFSLNTRPSSAGDELTLTLSRQDPASIQLTDVAKVYFKVTPQDVNAGSIRYLATRNGPLDASSQVYTATEQILTLEGTYQITAIVERTVASDMEAAFRLNLSEDKGLKATPADAVEMRLDSVPSPPVSGTVTLQITLLDGAGAPINDARLTVLPLMPAHSHVQPQSAASPVSGKPGMYTASVHLQMGGSWLFVCEVDRPGHDPVKVDSNVDVVDPNATPTSETAP